MSSTERGSSIGSSIFIPNWVKNSSGFDPSALSPPTHDGEFFYVRFSSLEKADKVKEAATTQPQPPPVHRASSLRKLIPKIEDTVTVVKPRIAKPETFEGIMSSSAAGGGASSTSIVAVAEQMIAGSGKAPLRGFATDDAAAASPLPSTAYLRQRRNSKSLPASPLASPETSPRARRKNVTTGFALKNRYLAGSSEAGLCESEENLDRKSGSYWLLAGLFSNQKDNRLAVVKENQHNSLAAEAATTAADDSKPTANQNVALEVKDVAAAPTPPNDKRGYLKKKRSEIRELNFISPVSM